VILKEVKNMSEAERLIDSLLREEIRMTSTKLKAWLISQASDLGGKVNFSGAWYAYVVGAKATFSDNEAAKQYAKIVAPHAHETPVVSGSSVTFEPKYK
jgi:hypothetical protein